MPPPIGLHCANRLRVAARGLREDELQQLPDHCPRGLQQTLKLLMLMHASTQLADSRLSLQPVTTSNGAREFGVCRWPLLVLLVTLMIPNGVGRLVQLRLQLPLDY